MALSPEVIACLAEFCDVVFRRVDWASNPALQTPNAASVSDFERCVTWYFDTTNGAYTHVQFSGQPLPISLTGTTARAIFAASYAAADPAQSDHRWAAPIIAGGEVVGFAHGGVKYPMA